jgi:hypothetical protein
MMVIDDKAVFIHYPKTGGTFVRTILNQHTNINNIGYGSADSFDHTPISELPDEYKHCKLIITVREPLSWYESAWKFLKDWIRGSGKFHPESPNPLAPLQPLWTGDFVGFVSTVLRRLPGYYSKSFEAFVEGHQQFSDVRFINTEMLTYGLMSEMNYLGIEFDPLEILQSVHHGQRNYKTVWKDPSLKSAVLDAEMEIIKKYYL